MQNMLWGKYQIIEKIGEGGMATVWLVQAPSRQYYVAKVIRDEQYLPQLTNEIEIQSQVHDHPQIPTIVDVYVEANPPGMVMDYVEGQPLNIQEGQPLSIEDVERLLADMNSILSHLHQRGFCHGDIKPSNILRDANGVHHLIDFGIAIRLHTTPRYVAGTNYYMSPEHILPSVFTQATDVYSLGVMIYESMTGRRPFVDKGEMARSGADLGHRATKQASAGEDIPDIRQQHLNRKPPRPSLFNPEIKPAVEEVILKALEKNPQDRFPSINAFSKRFYDVIHVRRRRILNPQTKTSSIAALAMKPAQLVCTLGYFHGQTAPISNPSILIGRGLECWVAIKDVAVSRRHSLIEWRDDAVGGYYAISDQGSIRGTRVNSRIVEREHRLQHNDLIYIAGHNFRFEYLDEKSATSTAPPPPSWHKIIDGFMIAVSLLSLIGFFFFDWYRPYSFSSDLYSPVELIFWSLGSGYLLNLPLLSAVLIASLILVAMPILRLMSINLVRSAQAGGRQALILALFHLRSHDTYHVTTRLGLAVTVINLIIHFLALLAIGSQAVGGLVLSMILAVAMLIMAAVEFPPIFRLLNLDKLIYASSGVPEIEGLNKNLTGLRLRLNRFPFSIGRHQHNDLITIGDKKASRFHAEIVIESNQYVIQINQNKQAQANHNPIMIGKSIDHLQPVYRCALSHGDLFRIGETLFQFRIVSANNV